MGNLRLTKWAVSDQHNEQSLTNIMGNLRIIESKSQNNRMVKLTGRIGNLRLT